MPSRLLTYGGVFLVSGATLMLEILLTRIASVIGWYHMAFFVISLAMLGMTAGAVYVFLHDRRYAPEHAPARMTEASLAFALTTVGAVAVALTIPLVPPEGGVHFTGLLGFGAVLAIPFAASGVALTVALTRAGLAPGLVYGVDLCGAAAGCIVIIPILDGLSAPSAAILAAAIAAGGALLFAGASRRWLGVAATCCVVLLAATAGNHGLQPSPLRPRWVKGHRADYSQYQYVDWNTYSRVTVEPTQIEPPSMWAGSRNTPPELLEPIPQRPMYIDGAAGTVMARLDVDPDDGQPAELDDHAYLAWDVTSFAHQLRSDGPAAVIGVGGGRDVLEAVRVGHRPVIGIELNDLIVALHQQRMAEFSGLTSLPGVELVEDEARSFLARDERRYAVLTMSLIDTWASTGAGAYSLSENGLYTADAWRTFIKRLRRDGIFTVSRWYKPKSPGETGRMLALAMETLWSLGATDPKAHIILLQNLNIASLMVSPTPFSAADLDRMQQIAIERGFNMVATPRKLPVNPTLRAIVSQPSRAALWDWAQRQPLDYTPPTDERPFFFNMLKPRTWLRDPGSAKALDHMFLGNLRATQTLVYAMVVSLILTLAAIVGPLLLRRRRLGSTPPGRLLAAGGYFALIGLGFMFVEIGLLSRLSVLLGHPTLALAVLLGGVILFTGLGSLISSRVPVERPRIALLYPLIPTALILAATGLLEPVLDGFMDASTGLRVLIGAALVAIPGLGLGLGFPLGLRLLAKHPQGEALGPWMWGINGGCGVVASGLALMSSMTWGISTTLAIGAVCYGILPLCTRRLARVDS